MTEEKKTVSGYKKSVTSREYAAFMRDLRETHKILKEIRDEIRSGKFGDFQPMFNKPAYWAKYILEFAKDDLLPKYRKHKRKAVRLAKRAQTLQENAAKIAAQVEEEQKADAAAKPKKSSRKSD